MTATVDSATSARLSGLTAAAFIALFRQQAYSFKMGEGLDRGCAYIITARTMQYRSMPVGSFSVGQYAEIQRARSRR